MLLKLVALQGLLVLDLLLGIFVALQNLVVLLLTFLEVLVHLILETLAERVHLSLLLLHEFGFGREDLFVAVFHVLLSFPLLYFIGLLLHLMRILIVLLLGQVSLDLALVQKLRREFEYKGQCLLKLLAILLQLLCVSNFELFNLDLVLLLGLRQHSVPMLVELLVLLDVCRLDVLLTTLVSKDHLLVVHVELLLLELSDSILSHFSLYNRKRQRIKKFSFETNTFRVTYRRICPPPHR